MYKRLEQTILDDLESLRLAHVANKDFVYQSVVIIYLNAFRSFSNRHIETMEAAATALRVSGANGQEIAKTAELLGMDLIDLKNKIDDCS